MPGRVIAVCAAAGFVTFLIYGLSFDVRRWIRDRRWDRRWDRYWCRDRERCEALLGEQALSDLHERALELQRVADEVTWVAEALAEIRDLPTAQP